MRRDHMAAMMCRALGWEDEAAQLPAGTVGFSDIPVDTPYWAAATYLKQQEVLLGYDDGTLRPEEPIKRQHVAVIALPGARPGSQFVREKTGGLPRDRRSKPIPDRHQTGAGQSQSGHQTSTVSLCTPMNRRPSPGSGRSCSR